MREYGECKIGPKCPNCPNRVKDSPRKYKDRFLLPVDYPIRGLQNSINGFDLKKECKHANLESGSAHLGTRAVKCDLNFVSLSWIFCVYIKPGECCSTISDIDFKLQLMSVNFTLSAIIWGDAKTHFVGISVDTNREKHIYYEEW